LLEPYDKTESKRRTSTGITVKKDIIEKVEISRHRYFGHVSYYNRLLYIAMLGRVDRTRCRGRPRKRWLSTIKDSEVRGMTFVEA